MASNTNELKKEITAKAGELVEAKEPKLKKSMSIADLIKAMEPEIKRALPDVITPERFTRMALSALNTNPKLAECSQISFLSALMSSAQLGLEPNTPLGQAYLIPYNNKGNLECQFQIGYKGMLELAYRNPQMQVIRAQEVYENDVFEYELGLEPKLVHCPVLKNRGEVRCFYGLFKLTNGGYAFEVMGKEEIDEYAKEHSQSFDSSFSPWKNNYNEMAKKTIIKKVLKYAPLKTDFRKALSTDETIKKGLCDDMSEVQAENIFDTNYREEVA